MTPREREGTKPVFVDCDTELKTKFDEWAKSAGSNMSQVIRTCMEALCRLSPTAWRRAELEAAELGVRADAHLASALDRGLQVSRTRVPGPASVQVADGDVAHRDARLDALEHGQDKIHEDLLQLKGMIESVLPAAKVRRK